jgi:hypothetical protein
LHLLLKRLIDTASDRHDFVVKIGIHQLHNRLAGLSPGIMRARNPERVSGFPLNELRLWPKQLTRRHLSLVCPCDRRTTASFGPLPAFVLTPQPDAWASAVVLDELGNHFLLSVPVNWVRLVKPEL